MIKTIEIDTKTVILKSDNETDLAEIIDFISQKDREIKLKTLFEFADKNRKIVKNYKFNRAECYEE